MNRKQAIVAMLAGTLPFTKLRAWDGGDPQVPSQTGGLVDLSRRVQVLEESSQASNALLQQIQATLQTHANRIQALEQAVAALQGSVNTLQGAVTSLENAQASIVGFERSGNDLVLRSPGDIHMQAALDLKLKGMNAEIQSDMNLELEGGMNAALKAGVAVKVEGLTMDLISGAVARLRSPVVMIN